MTVSFPDTVNIRNIDEITQKILPEISSNNEIELDLDNCGDIDLSALQLVESIRVYAASTGKHVRLSSPANAVVASVLARAGFTEAMSRDDRLFWLHKED